MVKQATLIYCGKRQAIIHTPPSCTYNRIILIHLASLYLRSRPFKLAERIIVITGHNILDFIAKV